MIQWSQETPVVRWSNENRPSNYRYRNNFHQTMSKHVQTIQCLANHDLVIFTSWPFWFRWYSWGISPFCDTSVRSEVGGMQTVESIQHVYPKIWFLRMPHRIFWVCPLSELQFPTVGSGLQWVSGEGTLNSFARCGFGSQWRHRDPSRDWYGSKWSSKNKWIKTRVNNDIFGRSIDTPSFMSFDPYLDLLGHWWPFDLFGVRTDVHTTQQVPTVQRCKKTAAGGRCWLRAMTVWLWLIWQ